MKKWQKVTGITLVSLIGAICVLYICLTSEWFIQKQVLPRVSKSVGQSITVDGIDLSLFSGVDIRNLEVGSGSNQLLRAGTIRLHYRLMPLFSGELAVDEILLDDVKVQITPESAAAPQAKPASEPVVSAKKEGGGGLPLKPVIRNVRIKNTHVFVKQNGADGKPLEFALENFNLELPEFKLDQMARIDLNGTLRLMQGPDVQLKNATLKGNIQAQIDSTLKPRSVQCSIALADLAGHVQKMTLNDRLVGAEILLTSDGSAFELKTVRLMESFRGQEEAAIAVTGKGTMSPLTADLNVQVGPIQPSFLNLVGALAGGMDFGRTQIGYQGTVRLQADNRVESAGQLSVSNASVTTPALKQALPPLDVNVQYALAADVNKKSVVIDQLKSGVREGGREIVNLSLSRPLTVSADAAGSGAKVEPAKLQLSVRQFNLLMANAFIPAETGTKLTSGTLNAEIGLEIADLGQQIRAEGTVQIPGLGADLAAGKIQSVDIKEEFAIELVKQAELTIHKQQLDVLSQKQTALSCGVTGAVNLVTLDGKLNVDLKNVTEALLRLIPAGDAPPPPIYALRAGGTVQAVLANRAKDIDVKGALKVSELTFQTPEKKTITTQAGLAFDVGQRPTGIHLRQVAVSMDGGGQRMVDLNVAGMVALPPSSVETALTIQSKILDLEPLLALSAALSGGQAKPAAASAKTPAAVAPVAKTPAPVFPVVEPPAVDLKGLNLSTDFRFDKIVYRQIEIAPMSGLLRVRTNQIVLKPFDLKLNQSPISMNLNVDLGQPGYRYEVHANSGAIDLQPVIQSVVPAAYRDSIEASIKSFKVDVKGAGITAENLSKNSDIRVYLETGAIQLNQLPYQDVAANLLNIPDLRNIRLDQGVFSLNSVINGVSIDGTRLSGPDYILIAKGKIGFDERLNLQFTPGIGGQLENALRGLPAGLLFTERNNAHLLSPSLTYTVSGTISKPEVPEFQKFLKEGLKVATKEHGKNMLMDAAGQFLKDGKVDTQELLNNRMKTPPPQTNAAPAATNVPPPAAPKPKTQEQQLIEAGGALIEGFFKKK